MKNAFIVLSLALFAFITGCSSTKVVKSEDVFAQTAKTPDVSLLKNGTILYRGYINFDGYELLKAEYEKAIAQKQQHPFIRIKSNGGYSLAGMKIGEFIRENHLIVMVDEYCLSACAHYIFPSAFEKQMHKNALVGLHATRSLSLNKDKLLTYQEQLAEYEQALFDEDITVNVKVKGQSKKSTQVLSKKQQLIKDEKKKIEKAVKKYFPDFLSACKETIFASPPSREQALSTLKANKIRCHEYKQAEDLRFYKQIGVNPEFKSLGLNKLKQIQAQQNPKVEFFYYDAASLKALGVDEVIYPKNWQASKNPISKKMVEITLSDWQSVQ